MRPLDSVALLSRSGRDERSRELAAWLELPADAVEAFVERMELSWQRQQAWETRYAAAEVEAAELEAELSDFWRQYGGAPPVVRLFRRLPRVKASE